MSKWEQLQQAYFLKPSICILIGLCFILLYLHKQIKKRGGKYKDYKLWSVFCSGLAILFLISYFVGMPQQVEPYQLHEASGVLHYSGGRNPRPYFDQSNGERWYIDFRPCSYPINILDFWEQEIEVFYVNTSPGVRHVYQIEYQGKLICSLEEANSYVWVWRLYEFIYRLLWVAMSGLLYFITILDQEVGEESNQK